MWRTAAAGACVMWMALFVVEKVRLEVGRLVEAIDDPEVLFRLAVISLANAYPQEGGLGRVDEA
jgi:hypothetical protein